jgi:hypothetical protein
MPSVWEYAGITSEEYAELREHTKKLGLCVFCSKPVKCESDDLCEDHRLSFTLWDGIRLTSPLKNLELRNLADELIHALKQEDYHPVYVDEVYKLLESKGVKL